MSDLVQIRLYVDGTWYYEDDAPEDVEKNMDFERINVKASMSEEEIEELLSKDEPLYHCMAYGCTQTDIPEHALFDGCCSLTCNFNLERACREMRGW